MIILMKDDSLVRIWDLDTGFCQQIIEQDAGISCMLMSPRSGYQDRLVFFGDQVLNTSFPTVVLFSQ